MPGSHLILFDGVCALCNWVVRFVLAHDSAHRFDFAPLDSPVGRSFLDRLPRSVQRADTIYLVTDYRGASPTFVSKGRAVARVAKDLDGPWSWLGAIDVVPVAILDWLYDVVARNRYAVFGRYDACPVPKPEHRARFIDR